MIQLNSKVLQSEKKERSKRFKMALEISMPFFFMIVFLVYMFIKRDNLNLENDEIILLAILIISQVYFTTYKIYQGFQTTILDPITGAFNRNEILNIISNNMRKFGDRNDGNVVMFKIKNLSDLNERYGVEKIDILLRKFIEKLEDFLTSEISNQVIIGRYLNGYFIMFCECKSSKLNHILNVFEKSELAGGVDDIEVKVQFESIGIDNSKKLDDLISILTDKINTEESEKFDVADDFEQDVCNSIQDKKFSFQTQLLKSLKGDLNLQSLSFKVYTDKFGIVTKTKAQNIANKNGLEIMLDINAIKKFCETVYQDENGYILEISAVSIRNLHFIKFLKEYIELGELDAKKIIFEFSEKLAYDEINRFKEILNEYKNLGFRFAINKFGSNNAGFEYFKYLPIDFIIYDIEFNKNLNDMKINKIFMNFNQTAQNLGIKSIVRFVDKVDFFEDIKSAGADYAQGFYIEKPIEI